MDTHATVFNLEDLIVNFIKCTTISIIRELKHLIFIY